MTPALGRRLRYVLSQFRQVAGAALENYPDVQSALVELESSVHEFFPVGARNVGSRRPRPGHPGWSFEVQVQRFRHKLQWARRAKRKAEQQVRSMRIGKKRKNNNAITPEFLAKVALSLPSTCARSFADSWRDLVGVGVAGCSRTSITRIRDAFVEVLQDMRAREVKLVIGSAAGAPASAAKAPGSAALTPGSAALTPGRRSAASSRRLHCVAVLHIHDEASLRLRSTADTDTITARNRSRKSSVQQHVVQLFAQGQKPVRWLCDLHPLGDKTAKVLATSLDLILRNLAGSVSEVFASVDCSERPWLVHWLVGDGVGTNEAAAKILLAWVRTQPLAARIRYFLIVVKCANHQANLAIGSAVCGKPALAGSRFAGSLGTALASRPLGHAKKSAATEVCGAIVRLFKYLVSDYYSDFVSNLYDIVHRLRAVQDSPQRQQQAQKWTDLHRLYGDSVFPEKLLHCLNGDIRD